MSPAGRADTGVSLQAPAQITDYVMVSCCRKILHNVRDGDNGMRVTVG